MTGAGYWLTLAAGVAVALWAVSGARADTLPEPTRISSVTTPDTSNRSTLYVSNRPPLAPSPLLKLPIGAIKPQGWLLEQLKRERDGFVGHLPEVSRFCREDSGWLHPEKHAWEEAPYWLKGFGDLGYVLGDEQVIAEAKRWLDAVIASQDEDGYFGPRSNKEARDGWSNMIMLYALRSRHEATGDPRIIPVITRYLRYRFELPETELYPYPWGQGGYRQEWWQHVRAGDELDSVYWLYNRTGEKWLLGLGERITRRWADWSRGIQSWHGVNICQGFRNPALQYQQTGDRSLLEAVRRNYRAVYDLYGQVPGGMFGADENCRQGHTGPRQAAETCSMVELMHSLELLLKITGEPDLADKCEDVAFNSLPASMSPDLRGLHYLTAPNMVQLDRASKAPGLQNGGTMLAFTPWRYRCCQHDVAMGWPYFAEHLWCATPDGGLAAVLYAAGEVTAKVGTGEEVTITAQTDYPFDETVTLKIKTAQAVRFPLYLRIPGWCAEAKLALNGEPQSFQSKPGSYTLIERTWSNGDEVQLTLPMQVKVHTWKANHDSVSVSRGPLTYSLKIGEKWVRYGDDDIWPGFEVFAATPWNYGLLLNEQNPAASFKLRKRPGPLPAQPFDVEAAPLELVAQGKRIDAWQLDRLGLVGELQPSPARVDAGPADTITLIPMGCARLRISAFPTVSLTPDAHVWQPPPKVPHQASHEYDDLAALSNGDWPKSSNDHDIPRFTWWPHKGTTEWVTFEFDEPQTVRETHVYWFDDTGRGLCRLPASWRILWKREGAWQEVSNVRRGEIVPNRFNAMTFDPVEANALKLEVELKEGFSGGILEWVVGPWGPR